MKFDGKIYFNICKILDKKLEKKEADFIKEAIEQLSKDNQEYIRILDSISHHTKRFNDYNDNR